MLKLNNITLNKISSITKNRLISTSSSISFFSNSITSSSSSTTNTTNSTTSTNSNPHLNSNSTNSNKKPKVPYLIYTSILSVGLVSGLITSYLLPKPTIIKLIYPESTSISPKKDSIEGIKFIKKIEDGIQSLKIVKELRTKLEPLLTPINNHDITTSTTTTTSSNLTNLETLSNQMILTNTAQSELVLAYTESRPYATSQQGPHSLSGSTLSGPGKFAVPPLVFTSRDKKSAIFILHLGDGLCGHEGVIHGGLLATVLDESLARTAFMSLPNNIGVTATLTLSYKKPTFANQYVVIKTELDQLKGRKAWVKGSIEDLDGNVLVKAEALFVEPKMAKFLSSSSIREHLK